MNYQETLRSSRWSALKWRRILRAEFRCEGCGRKYRGRNVRSSMRYLQLHHVHYRTVGNESLEDVRVLCRLCHRLEHNLVRSA